MSTDFRDLDRLAARLSNPNRLLAEISRNLAEESVNLVRDGWDRQGDPYGAKWAARKSAGAGGAILVRTGALRSSWSVKRASRTGFRIGSNQSYATYHQDGTGRMVPRMMVPKKGDVPPRWQRAFDDVATEILEQELAP